MTLVSIEEYRAMVGSGGNKKSTRNKTEHQFRPGKEVDDKTLTELFGYDRESMLFVPGNIPSSKNGKEIGKNRKTQKLFVRNNDLVLEYKEYVASYMIEGLMNWRRISRSIEPPIECGIHFVRNSTREFDFNNASQLIADLMKAYKWIIDDNINQIYFVPVKLKTDSRYSINKDYCCTILVPRSSHE